MKKIYIENIRNSSEIWKYLICILLGAGLVYFFFNGNNIDVDVKAYQIKIDLLEKKIDSIQTQNDSLQLEAENLFSKIDEKNIQIQKLNTSIYVIKKNTQKLRDAVDNFGDDELEKFFADRYNINDSIK